MQRLGGPFRKERSRLNSGGSSATIDAKLIGVKKALDRRSDKTAWLRWLKDRVHNSADTAQNDMRDARFAEKQPKRFGFCCFGAGRDR